MFHLVKSGDTLWDIAEKYYGTGELWHVIYGANQPSIEQAAHDYGMPSSDGGHWIFPREQLLTIDLDILNLIKVIIQAPGEGIRVFGPGLCLVSPNPFECLQEKYPYLLTPPAQG